MKKLAVLLAALLVAGVSLADTPAPRGLEQTVTFVDNATPFEIRVAVRQINGSWVPAQYCRVAADDSLRVVPVTATADAAYYPPNVWHLGDYDYEVIRMLRYTTGGAPLDWACPTQSIKVYGNEGAEVKITIWCEY